jgi:hypothetical protein
MRTDRVIFIHIPKAAGQTINSIVVRQYPRCKILHVEGGVGRARIPPFDGRCEAKLVIGHVHFGLHGDLPGSSSYMTMLREPVSRVLSLYHYIVSTPQHILHSRLADISLLDFAMGSAAAEEIENGQTRQIAGVTDGSPDSRSLAAAKQNLLESFVAVGIMERFDESLILFKRRLRWRMPYYVIKNASERVMAEEFHPDAIRVIRSRNHLDTELYQFASNLFEEQVRQEGPFFSGEVSAFRMLNAAAHVYRTFRVGARSLRRVAH